jgi:hypothetical protein
MDLINAGPTAIVGQPEQVAPVIVETVVCGTGKVKYTFDNGHILQFDLVDKTFLEQEPGKSVTESLKVKKNNLALFKRAIGDFNTFSTRYSSF